MNCRNSSRIVSIELRLHLRIYPYCYCRLCHNLNLIPYDGIMPPFRWQNYIYSLMRPNKLAIIYPNNRSFVSYFSKSAHFFMVLSVIMCKFLPSVPPCHQLILSDEVVEVECFFLPQTCC